MCDVRHGLFMPMEWLESVHQSHIADILQQTRICSVYFPFNAFKSTDILTEAKLQSFTIYIQISPAHPLSFFRSCWPVVARSPMEQSPSWEAVAQLVKKFLAFYGTWRFNTIFTKACTRSLYRYITHKAIYAYRCFVSRQWYSQDHAASTQTCDVKSQITLFLEPEFSKGKNSSQFALSVTGLSVMLLFTLM
jgi:hypothetical protein